MEEYRSKLTQNGAIVIFKRYIFADIIITDVIKNKYQKLSNYPNIKILNYKWIDDCINQ